MVETWSSENDLQINKKKSAILQIRIDKRTPNDEDEYIQGYPLKQEYKYLGIQIQEDLKLKADVEKRKQQEQSLKKQMWLIKNFTYNNRTKYHLWQTLFKSKLWYQTINLSIRFPEMERWAVSYMYRIAKTLLNIKGNPSTNKLLLTCFQMNTNQLIKSEYLRLNQHKLAESQRKKLQIELGIQHINS